MESVGLKTLGLRATTAVGLRANIRVAPLIHIGTKAAEFLIVRHAHVTRFGCKQTCQYSPESTIDESSEVRNVEDCGFPLLIVKKALK